MTVDGIRFYGITPDDCEGLGWRGFERERPFDRIPVCLRKLEQVYGTGQSSIGECVFFETDSTRFWVRETLAYEQLGEPNFNVCAFSGVDLYIFDDDSDRWRWGGSCVNHQCIQNRHPEYPVLEGIERKLRRCRMYLPMRNRLEHLEIGVEEGAAFKLIAPRTDHQLAYYGTSIIHGAYSTRSGLGIAQIVGRGLDMPVLNLGFSGACKMEPEMADMLTKLEGVDLLVVDPMHNVTPDIIRKNLEPFLDVVCQGLKGSTVVVVSAPEHLHSWLKPEIATEQHEMQQLLQTITARKMTVHDNLHFIDGRDFYGSDEVSADGLHPNDNAAWHMAQILDRKLRTFL